MPDFAEPLMVKYLHDKGAREGIPVSGTFELTQRCNFNCEMCYVHDCKQKTDPPTAEDWLNLAQQAKDAGTVFLLLTGGEPLIRDDFEEIYKCQSEEELYKMVDDLYEQGVSAFAITGGEPFLEFENMCKMLKYSENKL